MENKIINKEGCNLLVDSPVFSGTTKDLDECPTKLEINNTKKLIVLTPDILSDGVNAKNYDLDQLVEIEDVGRYLKCTYTNDCAEWCKFSFYNSGVNGSLTNSFYIFNNDDIVSGESEIGLTQNFVNTSWDSSLEIMVYLNVTYAQQCSINDLPATRFDGGFLWSTSDSATIKNAILNGDINIVISKEAVVYKLVPSISEGNITLEHGVESQITLSYNKYVGGVLNESVDVTNSALWTSSDETVATVNNGLVIVNNSGKPGPVTITATYEDQIVSWTINILSYDLIVSINEPSVYVGQSTYCMAYFIEYVNGVEKIKSNVTNKCEWISSLPDVAEHYNAGVFSGISKGVAVLTGRHTYNDVVYEDSCEFTVLANYITINPTEYTFEKETDLIEINVEFGGNVYRVSDTLPWTGLIKSGNVVTLTVQDNTTTSTRSGIITFKCGEATADFEVIQKGTQVYPEISLNKTSWEFDYTGGVIQNYAILTNADTCVIENLPDWITVNNDGPYENREVITFTIAENIRTDVSRWYDVVFSIPNTDIKTVFTIEQGAAPAADPDEPTVEVTGLSIDVDYVKGVVGTSTKIEVIASYSNGEKRAVTTNENLTYVLEEGQPWVGTYSNGTINHNGPGEAIWTFSYTENGVTVTTNLEIITTAVKLIDLQLSHSSETLTVGDTLDVTATLYFDNNRSYLSNTAQWVSNDSSIASVVVNDNIATITAVKAGKTFITVTDTYQGVTLERILNINVVGNMDIDVITQSFDIVDQNGHKVPNLLLPSLEIPLKAVLISNTNGNITTLDVTNFCTWTSSDSSVAQISNTGLLTTNRVGAITVIEATYIRGVTTWSKQIVIEVLPQDYYVRTSTTTIKVGNLNCVNLAIHLHGGGILYSEYTWKCIGGSDSNIVGKTGRGGLTFEDTTGTTKSVIMELTSIASYYNFVGDLVYPTANITLTVPANWSVITDV